MTFQRTAPGLARLTLVTGALVGILQPLLALDARADGRRCDALEELDLTILPDAATRITATDWTEAAGELPGYCEVDAYVAPQVGIRVRVPDEAWNGRFHFEGCWALCGELSMERANDRLARGYAVAVTDMGHRGTARSGEWAYNNLGVELDMAYRGTHKAVVAAKAIVAAYAGRPPSRSYWRGCSTGGRQGLLLAQRYPWHFDGIVAGAPAYLTPDPINLFWRTATNLDDAGRVILGKDQLPLLHQAAIGQCDGLDGLQDGVIDDPWKCRVDLGTLRCAEGSAPEGCLASEQIAAAERIYRGAVGAEGESLSPGALPGSELTWAMYVREPHGEPGSFEPLSVAALRYIFFDFDPGPGYDPRGFDYARDIERLFTRGFLYAPNNPDLSAFRKRGGKLLIYQGLNDLLDTDPLIDYYQKATRVAGGKAQVQSFFRLFLVPGMNHCRGGAGTDSVDWMAAMESWVETGAAPDVLIGTKLEAARPASASDGLGPGEPRVVKTRPLYPYPHIARYKGAGDPDAAASFEPVPLSR